MDKKLYDECYAYAAAYCNRRGYTNDIDDVANWLMKNQGKFKARRASDYFREVKGRYGSNKNKLEHASRGKLEPKDHPKAYQDHYWELWDLVLELPRTQRLFMFMHYRFGITLLEIGTMYGCTESRVSQIIQGAEKTLQRRMEEEKRPSERETLADLLSEEQGEDSFGSEGEIS